MKSLRRHALVLDERLKTSNPTAAVIAMYSSHLFYFPFLINFLISQVAFSSLVLLRHSPLAMQEDE